VNGVRSTSATSPDGAKFFGTTLDLMHAENTARIQKQTSTALYAGHCSPFRRRTSKCPECPYKDAKPSQRSRDELAYARCTPPEHFHCHMGHERANWSGSYGYGDGETMCRGHWEMYHAAVKRGIEADESAGDRVFGDDFTTENSKLENHEST
jgi:hypothetical protein